MGSPHVITDHNWQDFLYPVIDGERKAHGLKPRDYKSHPEGCFAWADPFPDSLLIPEADLDDALAEAKAQKRTLLDLRETHYDVLKSLDQDGLGLCWAFSSTKAAMYLRALMNEPLLVLSAWWVAGKVKGWRDEGGWGSESLEFIVANGAPEYSKCPAYRSSYDGPDTQSNAALHKVIKWWECSEDPDKAFHQTASAHARMLVTVEDFNWLSHSMCCVMTNGYKSPDAWADNSWGESAGEKGLYRLQGGKAKPNGAWVPYVAAASLA